LCHFLHFCAISRTFEHDSAPLNPNAEIAGFLRGNSATGRPNARVSGVMRRNRARLVQNGDLRQKARLPHGSGVFELGG